MGWKAVIDRIVTAHWVSRYLMNGNYMYFKLFFYFSTFCNIYCISHSYQTAEKKMRRSMSRIPVPNCEKKSQCDLGLSVIEEECLRENLAKMRRFYDKQEVKFLLVWPSILFLKLRVYYLWCTAATQTLDFPRAHHFHIWYQCQLVTNLSCLSFSHSFHW